MTTSFVSGTGGPLILEVFQFSGGPLVDLDAIPTITITGLANGGVVVGPTTTGVLHPAVGTYVYNWTAPVSGGIYQVVWNGTLAASPHQASEIVTVYSPSAVTVGPCDGWTINTSCCADWGTLSADLKANATAYATTVLWAATGRRFGLCTRTVRPCGKECGQRGINGYYWSEGTWLPYIFNGAWRNCWNGCLNGLCTCDPDCQLYLPGPVNSIISVTNDGVVVDPATYRVDDGQWLVRTHNLSTSDCWPYRQDMNLNSGTGTLLVSYLIGIPVPAPLLLAAGELACEWVKSCQGLPCRLPSRATSLSRQGVTVSMTDVETLLEKGLTGVATVDQLIRTYNPYMLTSKMSIASPDDIPDRVVTWP